MSRITSQDLMLAGWHGIWQGKQYWAHPEKCHQMVPFRIAAKIEKESRGDQSEAGAV